jgi:cadmium resistance protein CadD (predicted permease)
MKMNIGNTEKWIRIVLGFVIIALGLYFKSWWGLVGLVPLLTGIFNSCPAWSLFGVNTNKKIKVEKV